MKLIKAEMIDKPEGTLYRVTVQVSRYEYLQTRGEAGVKRLREEIGTEVDNALTVLAGR